MDIIHEVFKGNAGRGYRVYVQGDTPEPMKTDIIEQLQLYGAEVVRVVDDWKEPPSFMVIILTDVDTAFGQFLVTKFSVTNTEVERYVTAVVKPEWIGACVEKGQVLVHPDWGGFYVHPPGSQPSPTRGLQSMASSAANPYLPSAPAHPSPSTTVAAANDPRSISPVVSIKKSSDNPARASSSKAKELVRNLSVLERPNWRSAVPLAPKVSNKGDGTENVPRPQSQVNGPARMEVDSAPTGATTSVSRMVTPPTSIKPPKGVKRKRGLESSKPPKVVGRAQSLRPTARPHAPPLKIKARAPTSTQANANSPRRFSQAERVVAFNAMADYATKNRWTWRRATAVTFWVPFGQTKIGATRTQPHFWDRLYQNNEGEIRQLIQQRIDELPENEREGQPPPENQQPPSELEEFFLSGLSKKS